MVTVDRAAIFEELCRRNEIRKETGMKLLDMKAEYDHAVHVAEAARRRSIYKPHVEEVWNEILAKMRARFGPHWPSDLGGRLLFGALLRRILAERYGS